MSSGGGQAEDPSSKGTINAPRKAKHRSHRSKSRQEGAVGHAVLPEERNESTPVVIADGKESKSSSVLPAHVHGLHRKKS